jgi:hypothetical protein
MALELLAWRSSRRACCAAVIGTLSMITPCSAAPASARARWPSRDSASLARFLPSPRLAGKEVEAGVGKPRSVGTPAGAIPADTAAIACAKSASIDNERVTPPGPPPPALTKDNELESG